jgi:DNA-binding transcriptional LysR family regulator
LLRDASALGTHAEQLAMGAEPELRIVLGDLCPLSQTLELLSDFFDQHSSTRPQLHFEAISGPWERLFDGDADLIVHHIDKTNPKLDFIPLCTIRVIPVVAPGYLPFPVSRTITPEQLRPFVQCVIRDTASHSAARDYFLIDASPKWTVADQLMKKELILQGRVWGHLPTFLVEDEVREKRLLDIRGRHLPGTTGDLVAARRRDVPHGPVAEKLWRYIGERAGRFSANTNAELRRKRR